MDAPIVPAAPAQPTEISATKAAANSGDLSAFLHADESARAGKPLAAVAVETPEAAEAISPAEPKLSRKEREQNEANERVRKAVDAATADLRRQLDEVRTASRSAAPPAATAPPAEKPTTVAEYKRLMALPDAPKLAEFDSVEEHAIAAAVFVNQTLHTERAAADRQRTDSEQTTKYRTEQVSAFDTRVNALATTDPEITARIVPVAQQLGTLAKQGGPAATLSDLILESDVGPQILNHFHEHPETLASLLTPPAATRGLPTDAAVRVHFKHFSREFAKLESSFTAAPPPAAAAVSNTTTAAPPPPPSVSSRAGTSSDPASTAVARGDFDAFDQVEMLKERKRRGLSA